jgi:hypothetical protein
LFLYKNLNRIQSTFCFFQKTKNVKYNKKSHFAFALASCQDNSGFSFFILKKEELSDFCSDAKAKAKARAKGKSQSE